MARHRGSKKPPAAKKPPLTHFLCVPLVTPTSKGPLEASLKQFINAVSVVDGGVGSAIDPEADSEHQKGLRIIHPKAIRPVGALHLTLGVMSLDPEKLLEATDYLKSESVQELIKTTVYGSAKASTSTQPITSSADTSSLERAISPPVTDRAGGPLEIELRGLQSMHAAHKTSILYIAPTDPSDRLYPFCVALQKLFKDQSFLIEDNRQLKLHATVVNTIYAKGRNPQAKRKKDASAFTSEALQRDVMTTDDGPGDNTERSGKHQTDHAASSRTIDATSILEAYRDFVWVERIVLDRVSICEMGAKKVFDSEGRELGAEYTEVASVPLQV